MNFDYNYVVVVGGIIVVMVLVVVFFYGYVWMMLVDFLVLV